MSELKDFSAGRELIVVEIAGQQFAIDIMSVRETAGHLIEGMARAGQGESFIVTKPEQAAEQAEHLRQIIDRRSERSLFGKKR